MELESAVYGEWDDIIFKKPMPSDLGAILVHLKNSFYLDEPASKFVGYDEERREDLDNLVKAGLSHGLSIVAVHKPTGKVIGVQVTSVEDVDAEEVDAIPQPSVRTQVARKFFGRLRGNINIFERYKVGIVADLRVTSVSREFRRRGITKELYTRSVALLKEKQFPLVKATFTNAYTRKVAQQLGFTEINREYFSNFTDENGVSLFLNKPHPEDFASIMVLLLPYPAARIVLL